MLCLLVLVLGGLTAARAQNYSQIIVFGDSLSDTGNDADVSDDAYPFGRIPGPGPGGAVNYTNGRFTSGKDTTPASTLYGGVWHEQLAKLFLGLPASKASLDGGFDYAYGGATTADGTRPLSFGTFAGQDVSIPVNNMGQQITDYLAKHTPDTDALYIVWGGANDIFVSDDSASALLATGHDAADRETALIKRLAQAGAVTFLVPNLPPIGNTPRYNGSAGATAAYNAACEAFGTELNSDLDTLTSDLAAQGINITIYRLDVFGLFQRLLANQEAYGFYNIMQSAQGESVKADTYLFWDDVHPTAAGHYQLAVEAYTLLTGKPIIQIAPNFTANGIFFTRSGTDVSPSFMVPYTVGGTATPGTDYKALKGERLIKTGKHTVKVGIKPFNVTASKGKTVVLGIKDGGDQFGVGTVTTARVKFGNPIAASHPINAHLPTAQHRSIIVPNGQ